MPLKKAASICNKEAAAQVRPLVLLYDDIDETSLDDDKFADDLSFHQRADGFVGEDRRADIFLRRGLGDHHFRLDLAVDLYRILGLFTDERRLVADGVSLIEDGVFPADLFPELLAEMGGAGSEQEQEIVCAGAQESDVFLRTAFVLVEGFDLFHQHFIGGTEGEVFHFAVYVLDRVVALFV